MELVAAAASPYVYRRRRREVTVLYRALAHHFEQLVQIYEERFPRSHGYLRGCVAPAVYRYLDCGIFAPRRADSDCPRSGFIVLTI